jgi:hypothetical protein
MCILLTSNKVPFDILYQIPMPKPVAMPGMIAP